MRINVISFLASTLTICGVLFSSCAETDYLNSKDGVSINATFTKGDGTNDNDFLSSSKNFYTFAYNDNVVYAYKKGDALADVQKIDLKDAGTYNISMFANLSDDAFTAPDFSVPYGVFTLKDGVDIPDVCFGKCSYKYSTADSNQPSIALTYATCHLTVAVEAVAGDMKSVSATVMNMYNNLRIDGNFSGKSTRTFSLKQSDTDKSHFENTFVIFPTNGVTVLKLDFTDNNNNVTSYTERLSQELSSAQQMTVNFNQKTVTASVQLNAWSTLSNETYDVGTSYQKDNITLSSMPDFSATQALVYIDKMGTYCTGSVSTDANNNTTLSVSLPTNCNKIYAIKFINAQGGNFTAYLGTAGMGGESITNSTITIPAAPAVGDYFQYGYVLSQVSTSGWQAYNVKVGLSFNPSPSLSMDEVPAALAGYDDDGFSAWRLPTKDEFTLVNTQYFNDYTKYMSDVHQSPIPGTGGLLMKYYWTSDKNTDGNYYTMEPAKGSPTVSSSPSTDKNSLYIVRDL